MSAQPFRGTLRNLLATLILRGVALGGRFVFVIFATKYMLPQDFGRFGLLAGLALIVPVIVGLEAHQILLRRIVQEPDQASHTRWFYVTFAIVGSLVSGATGAVILACFGWPATEVSLGAAVILLEHVGLETSRNLVNERRPALSVLSVALRTGVWGVAVPAFFFLGFIKAPWTFETVLIFWIIGAIGAALAGIPIWSQFRSNGRGLVLRRDLGLLREVVGRSRTWIVYNASMRTIDTGGRFICAWMISDAAAGRFTFVSMLASLNYIAQKGVVEPIYYPRLTALDVTESTYREFRRITLAVVAGATICSMLGLAASAWINGQVPPRSELISFLLLSAAFALITLSQPAHYRLYRWHQDGAIMTTALTSCVVMIVASVMATILWGIAGTSAGVMMGAFVLLILKVRAANKLIQ